MFVQAYHYEPAGINPDILGFDGVLQKINVNSWYPFDFRNGNVQQWHYNEAQLFGQAHKTDWNGRSRHVETSSHDVFYIPEMVFS